MQSPRLLLACCLAALAGPAPAFDGQPGRDLAATCTGCHGTDGHALPGSGMAALAGTDRGDMLRKLREFRSGARPATVMGQIAKGYTDRQLELIAAYLAQQGAGRQP